MQDSMALANEAANEVVSGIRVIQSFKTEKHEANRYDDRLMDTRSLKTRRDMVTAFYLLARRVRCLSLFLNLCFFGDYVVLSLSSHTTLFNSICLSVCLCVSS